jgi:hypothetical protein
MKNTVRSWAHTLRHGIRKADESLVCSDKSWQFLQNLHYYALFVWVSQSQSHITTDGQSVGLSWCRAPSGAHDQIFLLYESYCPVHMGRPLWREVGSVVSLCENQWLLAVQSDLQASQWEMTCCLPFPSCLLHNTEFREADCCACFTLVSCWLILRC